MRRVLSLAFQLAAALALAGCGDPVRLVLVAAAGSNALSQGGSDSGSAGVAGGGSGSGGVGGTAEIPVDPCAPEAIAEPTWDSPALYTASYVSAAYPGQYMRFIQADGFIGVIDETVLADKEAASFEAIPGVWACECISLRPLGTLGSLLRHSGSRIYLHPAIVEPLYLQDATFCPEPGLADPEGLSFRSVNYPQRMIHLRNLNELWIDDILDTPEFALESTFYRETALLER